MSTVHLPVVAGAVAAAVFAMSMLPMLVKAYKTKDVSSYSLGHIALGNVGNVVYTVYVLHLPAGPIWVLHTFYTVSTALMLFWYLRYVIIPAGVRRRGAAGGRGDAQRNRERSTRPPYGRRPIPLVPRLHRVDGVHHPYAEASMRDDKVRVLTDFRPASVGTVIAKLAPLPATRHGSLPAAILRARAARSADRCRCHRWLFIATSSSLANNHARRSSRTDTGGVGGG